MKTLKKIMVLIIIVFPSLHGNAQVTVGSGIKPNMGSLLDLKERQSTGSDQTTADKGLGLPRVMLSIENQLFPMFESDQAYIDNDNGKKTEQDASHIGLLVYNANKCIMQGKGIYVWDGSTWHKLGSDQTTIGLNLSKDTVYMGSGTALQPLTTQTATISWKPNDAAVTPPTFPIPSVTDFTSFTPATFVSTTSPQTISFLPTPIPAATITNDPFASVTKQVVFSFNACGNETKTLTVNQTNKALMVNDKFIPDLVTTANAVSLAVDVRSNAIWTISAVSPAYNLAITPFSPIFGLPQGNEKYNGTSDFGSLGYNVTPNNLNARYNYVTFTDFQTPKRFEDVTLVVGQYELGHEPQLVEYKEKWEEIYGLTPGTDEPDSDGNISRNVNRVQWHRDQNNNIFFSALFGGERWMITNLAATSFDTGIASAPPISRNGASSTSDAYWQFPNNDTGLLGYRSGLLYNWTAATAGKNPVTTNQVGLPYGPTNTATTQVMYQGICPNGWHLPSDKDWTDLANILIADPTKYSINTVGTQVATTIKDIAARAPFSGKAFGLLEGGFNVILTGDITSNNVGSYGDFAFFRTSSSQVGSGNPGEGPVLNASVRAVSYNNTNLLGGYSTGGRVNQFSVRCKKD